MSASGGLRWTKTDIALLALAITVVLTVGLALRMRVYGLSIDVGKLQGVLAPTVQAAVAAELAKQQGVITTTVREAVAAEIDRPFLQESIGNAGE